MCCEKLTFEDYKSAYDEAKDLYNKVKDKVCYYFMGTQEYNLRTKDFIKYCGDMEGIDFCPFPFNKNGIAVNRLAGSLFIKGNYSLVLFNSSVVSGRQNFTKLHEICHYFRNKLGKSDSESYSDLLERGNYSYKELYEEAVVNFAAAMMQIPDEALCFMIFKGKNILQEFSNEFASSYSANLKRLHDYLIYEMQCNRFYANDLIDNYKNDPLNSELCKLFNKDHDEKIELFEKDKVAIYSDEPINLASFL